MLQSVPQTAGAGIAKDHLDVCLHPDGAAKRFANDARGFGALIGWLLPHAPARAVFAATGAYHRAFERALGGQGLPMVKVNPCQARRFAEVAGKRQKPATPARPCSRASAWRWSRPCVPWQTRRPRPDEGAA
jgi:transposase